MNTVSSHESMLSHPLKALGAFQDSVTEELRGLAAPHIEANPEFMELLPSDYEEHPAQKVTNAFYDSSPASPDVITEIATASTPHFPYMLGVLDGLEEGQKELSRINEDLAIGENLIVATNHGDIRDIAEVLAALHVSLIRTGEAKDRPVDFTTILMLSKMITHLSIYGNSAVGTLGNMCDRQYFSFPQTATTKKSGISERLVRTYNSVVREILQHQLTQGGNLFGMAPSGTTEKPIDDDESIMSLGSVTSGTIKLAMAPRTKVLPIAVWRDGEKPVFEVLDIPRKVQSGDQLHAIMGNMATRLSDLVPDKDFVYLDPR